MKKITKSVVNATAVAAFAAVLIFSVKDLPQDNTQQFQSSSVFAGASNITVDLSEAIIEDTKISTVAAAEPEIETIEESVEETPVEEIPVATAYNVPTSEEGCHANTYTYMSYTAITDESSVQYDVNRLDGAYTDEETGMRMKECSYEDDDYYYVAIGQGYGFYSGDYVRIFFADGTSIKAIIGDSKANCDTDPSNRYQKYDGSVVELIVDGDLKQRPEAFEHGKVVSIEPLTIG